MIDLFLIAMVLGLGITQIMFARKILQMFDEHEARFSSILSSVDFRMLELEQRMKMRMVAEIKIVLEQMDVIKKRLPPEPDKKLLKRGTAKKRRV